MQFPLSPPVLLGAHPAPRRRYIRLTTEQWAEARAAWSTGAVTAEELGHRYGCSLRAIQLHMAQRKVEKGSAMSARVAEVEARFLSEALPSVADLSSRIRQTRDDTYANAAEIQRLVMSNVQLIQDPTTALKAVAVLRALDMAAAAVGRTQRVRWLALGLDKGPSDPEELPELPIREMSETEVAEIRDQQLRDDARMGSHAFADEELDDDDHLADLKSGGAVISQDDTKADSGSLNEASRIGGHDIRPA